MPTNRYWEYMLVFESYNIYILQAILYGILTWMPSMIAFLKVPISEPIIAGYWNWEYRFFGGQLKNWCSRKWKTCKGENFEEFGSGAHTRHLLAILSMVIWPIISTYMFDPCKSKQTTLVPRSAIVGFQNQSSVISVEFLAFNVSQQLAGPEERNIPSNLWQHCMNCFII